MTPFRWIDRHGVAHDLIDGDAIKVEQDTVKAELLALVPQLQNADNGVVTAALVKAAPLRARYIELFDELRCHLRHTAEVALITIDEITAEGMHLARLHRCYDQRVAYANDVDWLLGPPSAEQTGVLALQARLDGRAEPSPASFEAAHVLLIANPATCRTPLPASFAAVEWTDRDMNYHRVRDLRQIEREYVAIAAELRMMAPRLAKDVPIRDTIEALDRARPLVRRIGVLERNMNRWTAEVIPAVRDDYLVFMNDLEK